MEMMKYTIEGVEAPTMEDVNRMVGENIVSFTRTLYLPVGLSLPLVSQIAIEKFIKSPEHNYHWVKIRDSKKTTLYTEKFIRQRENKIHKRLIEDFREFMEDGELWQ